MYSKEKQKPNKTHRNQPSFSSTLLEEICRSIDGNGQSPEKSRSPRPCLAEKRTEYKENSRIAAKNIQISDNDLLFFSSNSCSSDSSGPQYSSDTEFFNSSKKSNPIKRPKPIKTRTSVSPHPNSPYSSFDETHKSEDDSMKSKSKSRALKIYANLKKLKQPISPGVKLTNLINSFFANMKKSKDTSRSKVFQEQSYTTSSCVTKNPPNEKNVKIQRTVRFDPVGVIVDQDSKPCGKKINLYDSKYGRPPLLIVDQDSKPCGKKINLYDSKYGRPPLPPVALKVEKRFDFSKNRDENEDEDEDDASSDSSSDLFELDHLSLFCEELPVYKTTYFGKNRGLIR